MGSNFRFLRRPDLAGVSSLLTAAGLPVDDLSEAHLQHFIGLQSDGELVGVIGIEQFGEVALLRSLVVTEKARSRQLGEVLVSVIEDYARENNAHDMYLLTTDADRYFARFGYEVIDRRHAPASISNTAQFSSLCPDSAVFMKKSL